MELKSLLAKLGEMETRVDEAVDFSRFIKGGMRQGSEFTILIYVDQVWEVSHDNYYRFNHDRKNFSVKVGKIRQDVMQDGSISDLRVYFDPQTWYVNTPFTDQLIYPDDLFLAYLHQFLTQLGFPAEVVKDVDYNDRKAQGKDYVSLRANLLGKFMMKQDEIHYPAVNAAQTGKAESTEIKEAYIKSSKDAISVLANLRAMGKQGEHGGQVPPGFAGQVVNDLYDVMQWIEANIREDVTTEAAKPDFLDVDKDDDKEEPMKKALKDKEKVDEAMVVQADGSEAMALLNILKLAGVPAPQPAAEEREIEHSNTPAEHEFPHDAAVPSGTDLHKQKSAHRAAAGGDNAMAAEELTKLEGKLKGMFESMIAAGE